MTMPPYESFEHAGLAVRILYEEYIDENDNPRTNQDGNLGLMFCDYAGYSLGDKDAPDPRDQTVPCPACNGSGEAGTWEVVDRRRFGYVQVRGDFATQAAAKDYIERHAPAEDAQWYAERVECKRCEGAGQVAADIVEYLKREHGARVILPLFVYEHSGITMSCGGNLAVGKDNFDRRGRFVPGDGWDTSSVGVIFDTAATREECGWTTGRSDEEIEKNLREEVRYYAAYLENQVFGYEVVEPERDEDGEFDPEDCEGEVLGSCWGFLCAGREDFEHLRSEARAEAEGCARAIARERAEAYRWACADVVTV